MSAERCCQPATMSLLLATARPLSRPRSSSSRFVLRQSGASSGIGIFRRLLQPHCHSAAKCFTGLAGPHHKPSERRRVDVSHQELIRETACSIVDKLRNGEVNPLDLLDVLEKRIGEVDGKVNALPIVCFDRAHDHASALMKRPDGERGLLAGLPVPIKDLINVAGVRNTQGSPIFKNYIPADSDILVEHLEDNGAVVYAKSNTPEFGAGANTFNEVFGPTLNPFDTSRSAAGSSGGAAVALATGMAWLAHGSDMG